MPADFVYDAFISYNQKLDKPFVRRLQKQLQGLGKAWWQRRAVRIFRDETSLSATPEMWPSIERALAKSRYLIVCGSPEASASHWVNEEVRWWLAHKSRDTLLIALTAGELQWDRAANNFAWSDATPLPPAFKGAFATEPKWTDFRAYRALTESDRADDAFLGLAADIASTIRDIPKEDLLSEEVRQQRRALRTAYVGAASLTVVAVLAAWLGYRAYERGNEAREQRDSALHSQSRMLASRAAVETRNGNPVASALIALEALDGSRQYVPEAELSLDSALREMQETLLLPHDGAVNTAVFSPDGKRILTASQDKTARIWDAKTGRLILALGGQKAPLRSAAFNKDGSRILTIGDSDDEVARIWDANTGRLIAPAPKPSNGTCNAIFSPDGRWIAVFGISGEILVTDSISGTKKGTFYGQCRGGPSFNGNSAFAFSPNSKLLTSLDEQEKALTVYDIQTGVPVAHLKGHTGIIKHAAFSDDGSTIITASEDGTVRIWDVNSGQQLRTFAETNVSAAWISQKAIIVLGENKEYSAQLKIRDPISLAGC